MVNSDQVKERIQNAIPCEVLEVEDTSSGCGSSFRCLIVSPSFIGQPLLQRHRLIFNLFEQEMKTEIHAFNLSTLTPEQYQSQR
ncbi:unnamed protein product [Blepharisma stoltei]|uniref:BolA-like protein n=1 Tax=Blepharisma stoltei TaxID=1481888 RepID=A0AAU9K4L2_9CILI|nr:unnamed protein product [Blepharisma stoltei]